MNYSTKRVLVIGYGKLGSRIVSQLLKNKYQIWVFNRSLICLKNKAFSFLKGDLENLELINSSFPSKINFVIYCVSPDEYTEISYRKVFIEGLKKLIKTLDASYLIRFIFISSASVYGDFNGSWVNENTLPKPVKFNGKILLEAEEFLKQLYIPTVSLRLSGIYGPEYLGFLKGLVSSLNSSQNYIINNNNIWTNRIYIDDVVSAVEHLVNKPTIEHSCYICTDNTPLPLNILYQYCAKKLGVSNISFTKSLSRLNNKKLSNALLRKSGWSLKWPNTLIGYSSLIEQMPCIFKKF
ncbi:MAG: NAD-dependent epimerase/dehydratase family protein [Bordetella sp.]|nr:MAG: NAD-dependent epimerase/dehydratase family protein [Bordetella sp.]